MYVLKALREKVVDFTDFKPHRCHTNLTYKLDYIFSLEYNITIREEKSIIKNSKKQGSVIMNSIKRLTKEEEQAIIDKYIKDENYLDAGSSRAVYLEDYGAEVVKIALSDEGRMQNKNEVEYYKEHGHTGYFADIYAYGEFVVIMEYVDVEEGALIEEFWTYYEQSGELELDDLFYEEQVGIDWDTESREDSEILETIQRIDRQYEAISRIFAYMTDVIGNFSADNAQIGMTPDGYKLYDYGYNDSISRGSQVGRISDIIWGYKSPAEEFRNQLIDGEYIWRTITPIEKLQGEPAWGRLVD